MWPFVFNDIIEFYYKVSQKIKRDAVRGPEAVEMSSELSCDARGRKSEIF